MTSWEKNPALGAGAFREMREQQRHLPLLSSKSEFRADVTTLSHEPQAANQGRTADSSASVAGAFATISAARSPARLIMTPWPGKMPPLEARVAPGFEALVVRLDFVGSASPGRRARAILWPARNRLGNGTRSAWRARRCGQAQVCERVNQSWVNRQALAINHPSLRGGDEALRDHHGAAFNHRPGHRHNARAANRKVWRLTCSRASRPNGKQAANRNRCHPQHAQRARNPRYKRNPENPLLSHHTPL